LPRTGQSKRICDPNDKQEVRTISGREKPQFLVGLETTILQRSGGKVRLLDAVAVFVYLQDVDVVGDTGSPNMCGGYAHLDEWSQTGLFRAAQVTCRRIDERSPCAAV